METTKRKWSIQAAHTRSIGARLPNDLFERLKTFCAQHGETTTGVVCSPRWNSTMDSYEDDGREDGGYFLTEEHKKAPQSASIASRGCLYGGELGI